MSDQHEPANEELVVPVVEEQLKIGRRAVDTGRTLRVRKVVEEVPGTLHEPVFRELVETRRVPVGRVLQEPVGTRQEGDVTIVPVLEERLVLRKELFLVEEVHISRRREVRESGEQVTLRRESVVIERFDPATQQWLSEDEG
jgi:uncharacterized protein (TIGR02271 family)